MSFDGRFDYRVWEAKNKSMGDTKDGTTMKRNIQTIATTMFIVDARHEDGAYDLLKG